MSPPSRTEASTEALRQSLVDHARTLVSRDGPGALTMRNLAAEAGCAVGLPYKVFADRNEIVVAICRAEVVGLADAAVELEARAGTETVGEHLRWFSQRFLDSPAVGLINEILGDAELTRRVAASHDGGDRFTGFEHAYESYLRAEQDLGRVRGDADVGAVAFLLAGAVHNLVVAGAAWPRPTPEELAARLDAVAALLAPTETT